MVDDDEDGADDDEGGLEEKPGRWELWCNAERIVMETGVGEKERARERGGLQGEGEKVEVSIVDSGNARSPSAGHME